MKILFYTVITVAGILCANLGGDDLQIRQDEEKTYHVCTDAKHIQCDGQCECDGLECKNSTQSY